MDIFGVVNHRYVLNYIDRMNIHETLFFLFIETVDSIFLLSIINYFWWILMGWFFFTYINLISYFIIDTITWLWICLLLKMNECINWSVVFINAMRKVWSSNNIITVWSITIFDSLLCDITVVNLLFLNMYKTLWPCLLLDNLNTISSFFLLWKKITPVQSTFTLKFDLMFDVMSIKHQLIFTKMIESIFFLEYSTKNWSSFHC